MKSLGAAIALACAAPHPLMAQVIVNETEAPEAPAAPAIDPATLDEKGLRALVDGRRYEPAVQARAIRELRSRFGSAAVEAFAGNGEGSMALDASDGPKAYSHFTKVRASHSGNSDPAVQVEVARAIQGQAQAQDLIEAGDLTGPTEPVTSDTIRLDVPSYRLRRELVDLYGRRSEPGIRRVVAQERLNLAISEAIAGKYKAGPETFLGIVRDFERSTDPEVQRIVAEVFSTLAHFERDRRKEIEWHGEIIRRFSASRHPVLREKVGNAYSNKLYWLEELGETEESKRVQREYDEWSARGR